MQGSTQDLLALLGKGKITEYNIEKRAVVLQNAVTAGQGRALVGI